MISKKLKNDFLMEIFKVHLHIIYNATSLNWVIRIKLDKKLIYKASFQEYYDSKKSNPWHEWFLNIQFTHNSL